ncbi:MAG: ATP phosphoribosyltransferase regulatory subunit [Nitrospirota bacterium]
MRAHSSLKPKTLVPKGVAAFLPEAVLLRRKIEKEIFSVFFRAGYQEVITPLFEYLDLFSQTSGDALLDRSYQFVDRATGRMMALRPDVTPQIARMAATWLSNRPRPLRLCYSANLFRHAEEHAGLEREILQMGAEQIGIGDPKSDAEMIILATTVLKKLKIKSKIVLGQSDFIRGILKPFESNPILFGKILGAIARKEMVYLTTLLKDAPGEPKLRKQILALPNLLGGKAVLESAKTFARNSISDAGLKRLSEVVCLLEDAGISDSLLIDLSEVKGFDYYTGIVFEIFSDSSHIELGGGGRYDGLSNKFNLTGQARVSEPAIGFALDIEQIQRVKEPGLQ